jgi:hypothetical protein
VNLFQRGLNRWTADLIMLAALLCITAVFGRPFSKLGLSHYHLYVTEMFLMAITVAAVIRTGIGGAFARIKRSIPFLPLLVFWIAGGIAAVRGLHAFGLSLVAHDIGLVEYSFFVPLVAVVADTSIRLGVLMKVLMAGGIGATALFTYVAFVDPASGLGTAQNPTSAVGIYLAFVVLPVAVMLSHQHRPRPPLLVVAGWAVLLMSLTVTRSVTVAAFVALLFVAAAAPRGSRIVGFSVAIVAFLAVFFGSSALEPVQSRTQKAFNKRIPPSATASPALPGPKTNVGALRQSFDPNNPSGMNANARWRVAYWHHLIDESAHNPLVGVGFGKPTAFRWSGVLYDARKGDPRDPFDVTPPHNSFLNVLFRTGLLGFVPLLVLVFIATLRAIRYLRKPLPQTERVAFVAVASVFAFVVVIANLNVALEGPYMSMFFWTLLALLLIIPKLADCPDPVVRADCPLAA